MTETVSIRRRLDAGERLTGCWISMFSAIAAEVTAAGGYDIAMIDLEHGPGSLTEAISMMQAVESRGVRPFIRSPSSNEVDIKRILDTGPDGIMIPNIRNAAHAAEVIRHCRYGPAGDRGAAPGYMRAMDYGGFGARARQGSAYSTFMDDDFTIIMQVESASGVNEIDQIAATDGLDMVFIGPADLSSDLGQLGGFDRPAFGDAMSRITTQVRAYGKTLGCIPFADWDARALYQAGFQLVLGGADAIMLAAAARADAASLREAAND